MGQYSRRHDRVLKVIREAASLAVARSQKELTTKKTNFLKEGSTVNCKSKPFSIVACNCLMFKSKENITRKSSTRTRQQTAFELAPFAIRVEIPLAILKLQGSAISSHCRNKDTTVCDGTSLRQHARVVITLLLPLALVPPTIKKYCIYQYNGAKKTSDVATDPDSMHESDPLKSFSMNKATADPDPSLKEETAPPYLLSIDDVAAEPAPLHLPSIDNSASEPEPS
ncbi:hypothetical protein evm_011663 [Chilo suppressalis]|nr:hypothetical protein evm_011663 [Chilo suppressalis]